MLDGGLQRKLKESKAIWRAWRRQAGKLSEGELIEGVLDS
jgi:hypothetical protein